MIFDVAAIRSDFPILSREVNDRPLVYLDNGASSQKPKVVIDAIKNAYAHEYANVHRGLHYLSNTATEKYEAVRSVVATFLNVPDENDIILNTGTTEGINMVAYGWAMNVMEPGDEIILSVMEHHANIVPWHFLRERNGIVLKWVDIDEKGALHPDEVLAAISPKTKLIALTQMSNVLGTKVDIKAICEGASSKGIPVLVDGSQGAVHMPVDISDIGCDFYTITGHKLCGPSGSGAIYVNKKRVGEMRPFIGGGDMIREVHKDQIVYNDTPHLFEAGTPGIVETIGLGVALNYIMDIGMEKVETHEAALIQYASAKLNEMEWLNIQGQANDKGPIFSFTIDGCGHAHDISTILDKQGIAVRAGQHCAGPLMDHLGIFASCRASFAFYNSFEEVDALASGLRLAKELLG